MSLWFSRENRAAVLDAAMRSRLDAAASRASAQEIRAESERLIADSKQIRERIAWITADGFIACLHAMRPDAAHEVIIMAVGKPISTRIFADAASAEDEIQRTREMFAA